MSRLRIRLSTKHGLARDQSAHWRVSKKGKKNLRVGRKNLPQIGNFSWQNSSNELGQRRITLHHGSVATWRYPNNYTPAHIAAQCNESGMGRPSGPHNGLLPEASVSRRYAPLSATRDSNSWTFIVVLSTWESAMCLSLPPAFSTVRLQWAFLSSTVSFANVGVRLPEAAPSQQSNPARARARPILNKLLPRAD